ncbi:MAG: pyrroloquinoline quinone-dependent dehydrogenase [Gemmatimonadota bacterium]
MKAASLRHVAAVLCLPLAAGCGAASASVHASAPPSDWPAYGGDAGGRRYSPLTLIDTTNVGELEVAWTFRTGELGQNARDGGDLTFEATPIHFEGALYLPTAFGAVFSLDPVTGAERWRHDSGVPRDRGYSEVTSRGVSAWRDPRADPLVACAARIFYGTIDARLIALDAGTGERCEAFGDRGVVDLFPLTDVPADERGNYQVTSAPAVVDGVVVVGPSMGDNWRADTGDGSVRGFDARTGELLWGWEPIARVSPDGGHTGAANAWSTISADPKRGLVFVPTGSASPDFFGGLRRGSNEWANSVVALRARTGEIVWGFQTVHHDLFDYDVAPQPLLADIPAGEHRGRSVVVQASKTGFLFVLDRDTGRPVFGVEERDVPASSVAGERAASTQPVPLLPAPLIDDAGVDPRNPWGPTEEIRRVCREMAEGAIYDGAFTPPALEITVQFPGNGAGTNWGSTAFHPGRGLLVVPTLRYATLVRLIPADSVTPARARNAQAGRPFEIARQEGAMYGMMRRSWIAPGATPCTPPPWGVVTAVDLSTGLVAWERPFGSIEGLSEDTGAPLIGGPIVTAGGLVFMGASVDGRIRALSLGSGEELWRAPLPAAGIATPMTYRGEDGRQYVVIAAGGHGKVGLPSGDYVVAFALPGGPAGE